MQSLAQIVFYRLSHLAVGSQRGDRRVIEPPGAPLLFGSPTRFSRKVSVPTGEREIRGPAPGIARVVVHVVVIVVDRSHATKRKREKEECSSRKGVRRPRAFKTSRRRGRRRGAEVRRTGRVLSVASSRVKDLETSSSIAGFRRRVHHAR